MSDPKITKIEIYEYEYFLEDMGKDYNGFNLVYEPGGKVKSGGKILRIHTDAGVVGEYAGGSSLRSLETRFPRRTQSQLPRMCLHR